MVGRLGQVAGLLLLAVVAVSGISAPAAAIRTRAHPEAEVKSDPDSVPVVMSARFAEQADRTRIVVELSDPVGARVFMLANPDRVVVDMPEVLWRLGSADRPNGRGVVKSYRYGLFRPGNSRFVIDLRSPAKASDPVILPPQGGNGFRIVVDLLPTTQARFAAMSGWPADLRAREASAEQLAMTSPSLAASAADAGRRVVVLDPGHGGIDAGASGVDGVIEKDLVLDEALRLRKILRKRGYSVHLTRDGDVYVPLAERVNMARALHADLFVSLHADSNPDPDVYGASIYTLSAAGSDREAAALARKENQSDVIAGVDLSGQNTPVASILIGLAQRDTLNRSAQFAQSAVRQLEHVTDILPRDPHRSAAFVVLKAPDIPAVLVELGYLSNPRDCSQMSTSAWRDRVASALAGAIDRQLRNTAGEAAQETE
ncbi:MAG TPA: N-acetylmuramoyl-L-alanine amidase [Rhizomicrobium sp.]|jgi:N-acetylmuramoyl-L-alanine amidase